MTTRWCRPRSLLLAPSDGRVAERSVRIVRPRVVVREIYLSPVFKRVFLWKMSSSFGFWFLL